MPTHSGGFPSGLAALVAEAGKPAPARPVERWNPRHCGDIDIRIAADGTWHYRGSIVNREALVRLFASILRREPDGSHVLVTPVEKLTIRVDDAPFSAVQVVAEGQGERQRLTFRTSVGDVVTADTAHPLRFSVEAETSGLKPYLTVRSGLEALATRALALELVDLAVERGGVAGLWSGGVFFPFPTASSDGE